MKPVSLEKATQELAEARADEETEKDKQRVKQSA
jgi:hypothetical protein